MPDEDVKEALASVAQLSFPWPTHTTGHDKYAAFQALMENRQNKPDEVIWFLVAYIFDLERRFSALRMAVADAAGNASPNSTLVGILAEDEQALNVNPTMPNPPLEYWENLARIAGAQMKAWMERVNPSDGPQSQS